MNKGIIPAETTIRGLANMLENHSVLFVQREGKLLGSVTNGDFRRGIAGGASLGDPVTRIMCSSPKVVHEGDSYKQRLEKICSLPKGLRYLPVLDAEGRILSVISDKALMVLPNTAVLMAGGLGSRLKSLTSSTPKPMLRIGEKPVLQLIIEQFRRAGVTHFIISLNYKPEVIRDYFKDGSSFDVQIEYIQETYRMGTAGCLSLLENVPQEPFFVMNGDILTDLDPHELLRHHQSANAAATVCVHQYRLPVPYGVIRVHGEHIQGIEEKPNAIYDINAGIYVLNPECVQLIPSKEYFDMTSLMERILKAQLGLGAYKLPGFWLDIGNLEDFQRANYEYAHLARDLGSAKEPPNLESSRAS